MSVRNDLGDIGEEHLGVLLPSKQPADRRGNVGGGDRRCRHLIQQRLEDVVVRTIQHRQIDGRIAKRACRVEATEASADDDDVRAFHVRKLTRWGALRLLAERSRNVRRAEALFGARIGEIVASALRARALSFFVVRVPRDFHQFGRSRLSPSRKRDRKTGRRSASRTHPSTA